MNFSLGGVKRALLVSLATVTLSVSLAACSDGDKSPLDDKPSATATPDQKAIDEAAIKDTYDRLWAAMTVAENNADPDPERFKGLFGGTYGELYLKRVRDYQAQGIKRSGQAAITKVKVTLNGDTAAIRACINEDDWLFKKGGKLMNQPKFGTHPIAAALSRSGDGWVVTDFPKVPKEEKC